MGMYFYSVHVCKETTVREVQEIGDTVQHNTLVELNKLHESTLKLKINWLLENKPCNWQYALEVLLKTEEGKRYTKQDDELTTIEMLYYIYKAEVQERGSSVLEKITSLSQGQEVFFRTLFYFRRLELDVDKIFQMEFLEFIREWDISELYLITILMKNKVYRWEHASQRLIELMDENDRKESAEIIGNFVKKEQNKRYRQ